MEMRKQKLLEPIIIEEDTKIYEFCYTIYKFFKTKNM